MTTSLNDTSTILLHRISHWSSVSFPLLDKGWLCTGYNLVGKLDHTNNIGLTSLSTQSANANWNYNCATFKEIKSFMQNNFSWVKSSYHPRQVAFFLSLKPGDIVVVPYSSNSPNGSGFGIFEVLDAPMSLFNPSEELVQSVSDTFFFDDGGIRFKQQPEQWIDLGYVIKVKPLTAKSEHIHRSLASSALQSRMKTQSANLFIGDLKQDLSEVIHLLEQDITHNNLNLAEEANKSINEALCRFIQQKLSPNGFENLIRGYFVKIGASEAKINAKNQPKHDKEGLSDVDVSATFNNLCLEIHVQAKHHSGITNADGVKQLIAFKKNDYEASSQESADNSITESNRVVYWVITSGDDFSEEAKRLASENDILLINCSEFANMLMSSGFDFIGANLNLR